MLHEKFLKYMGIKVYIPSLLDKIVIPNKGDVDNQTLVMAVEL